VAALARVIHQRTIKPLVGEFLSQVEASHLTGDPESAAAVNIREWRRRYDRHRKIPEALAVALAEASSQGETAWEKARANNDWPAFRPYLERILALKREEAEAVGYAHECYDAFLDEYEPGETAVALAPLLVSLRQALSGLLWTIQGSPRRPDTAVLARHFPRERQERLVRLVAAKVGYDFTGGRLDPSVHPFCTDIGPGDVRITTRYNEHFFPDTFFSVLHEVGHAFYAQGLLVEHWGTPLGQQISYGIDESQSRFWENLVGRSRTFWEHFYPLTRQHLPALDDVPLEAFHFAINAVEPSLIRVDADEVTYNLHIVLRFELERSLVQGDLKVADLPGAWNDKMKEFLGVSVPDFRQGVLQDPHWAGGELGYFPTYTLGNLYAAQFLAQAEADLGNLAEYIRLGDFPPVLAWLRTKIHQQGCRYTPRLLVKKVTGRELSPQFFMDYLTTKFSALYKL
jgi:carboxypeptidase Taq